MKVRETVAERAEIRVVGKSGQISFGKHYAGKALRLERRGDGTMLLTVVPESQLWTFEEPHRSRIQRGLTWTAETAPRDTDVDALVTERTPRAGRAGGRRRRSPWPRR